MKTSIISGNIEIKRNKGQLNLVSVVMPVWDKTIEDGFLSIDIPLFAITTFAKDESDIEQSVREAITLFCINAEKFGNSLESELKILGWNFNSNKDGLSTMSFEISNKSRVFGQVMQTGEQFAEKLKITC